MSSSSRGGRGVLADGLRTDVLVGCLRADVLADVLTDGLRADVLADVLADGLRADVLVGCQLCLLRLYTIYLPAGAFLLHSIIRMVQCRHHSFVV